MKNIKFLGLLFLVFACSFNAMDEEPSFLVGQEDPLGQEILGNDGFPVPLDQQSLLNFSNMQMQHVDLSPAQLGQGSFGHHGSDASAVPVQHAQQMAVPHQTQPPAVLHPQVPNNEQIAALQAALAALQQPAASASSSAQFNYSSVPAPAPVPAQVQEQEHAHQEHAHNAASASGHAQEVLPAAHAGRPSRQTTDRRRTLRNSDSESSADEGDEYLSGKSSENVGRRASDQRWCKFCDYDVPRQSWGSHARSKEHCQNVENNSGFPGKEEEEVLPRRNQKRAKVQPKNNASESGPTIAAVQRFQCPYCDWSRRSDMGLKAHLRRQHGGKGLVPCPKCNSVLIGEDGFKLHEGSRWCKTQQTKAKRAPKKSNSEREESESDEDGEYVPAPTQAASSSSAAANGAAAANGQQPDHPQIQPDQRWCEYCNYAVGKNYWRSHERSKVHQENGGIVSELVEEEEAEVLSGRKRVRKTAEADDQRVKCPLCDARRKDNKSLKAHLILQHDGKGLTPCPVCKANFFNESDISVHQKDNGCNAVLAIKLASNQRAARRGSKRKPEDAVDEDGSGDVPVAKRFKKENFEQPRAPLFACTGCDKTFSNQCDARACELQGCVELPLPVVPNIASALAAHTQSASSSSSSHQNGGAYRQQ